MGEMELMAAKPIYYNKNYMLLTAARFVSQVGDRIHFFALTWYILDTIGTGGAVGTLMFFSILPGVMLGPFTGVLADRLDRRKIMMLMDVIRGIIAVTLGYLVFIGHGPLWVLYAGTVLLAICSGMYGPASMALFPNLVRQDQLVKANSFNSFLGSAAMIIGAPISGLLYSWVGAHGAFGINGATFVFSAICEFFIVAPIIKRQLDTKAKAFFTNLKEGFIFAYKTKALFAMLVFGLVVNIFFFPVQDVIQPIIVKNILKLTAADYGTIVMFFPGGLLLSTLLLQVMPQPKKKHKFMIWSMFCQAMGLILLIVPILPFVVGNIQAKYFFFIYCGISLLRGAAFGFTNVPMAVVNQTLIPDELRGRIYALQGTFYQGLTSVASLMIGFAVDSLPAYFICAFAGVCMGIACLVMFRVEGIKSV